MVLTNLAELLVLSNLLQLKVAILFLGENRGDQQIRGCNAKSNLIVYFALQPLMQLGSQKNNIATLRLEQ